MIKLIKRFFIKNNILLLVITLILSSCFNPWQSGDEAVLTINLGTSVKSIDSRAVVPWPPQDYGILEHLEYKISLTSADKIINLTAKDGDIVREIVKIGFWNVQVKALYKDKPFAEGSDSITVKSGTENKITIPMNNLNLICPDCDVEKIEPTCIEEGWEIVTCHFELHDNEQSIDPIGHNMPDWDIPIQAGEQKIDCRHENCDHFVTRNIYAVTFDLNGGTSTEIVSQLIIENEIAVMPVDPVKSTVYSLTAGLYLFVKAINDPENVTDVFIFWSEDGIIDFSFSAPIIKNTELTAVWRAPERITQVGSNNVSGSCTYVRNNAAVDRYFTLLLDDDDHITNVVTRDMDVSHAKLTIIGLGGERKISHGQISSLIRVGGSGTNTNVIGAELTIGNNITLEGHTNNTGALVGVQPGGTFTMNSGSRIINCPVFNVAVIGGDFFMNGGEISGGSYIYEGKGIQSNIHGGGVYITSGNFYMSAGLITGNTATHVRSNSQNGGGGGVALWGDNGTFIMTGGTISGNFATTGYGGGVFISDGATFIKTGNSIISGNDASGYGDEVFWRRGALPEGWLERNTPLNEGDDISTDDLDTNWSD